MQEQIRKVFPKEQSVLQRNLYIFDKLRKIFDCTYFKKGYKKTLNTISSLNIIINGCLLSVVMNFKP